MENLTVSAVLHHKGASVGRIKTAWTIVKLKWVRRILRVLLRIHIWAIKGDEDER